MYPNVRAEMARKGVTLTMLANEIGVALNTLSLKMSGKNDFTFGEVVTIKRYLGVDIPLETLFEKAV